MSTGMRTIARIEQRAIAITNTIIVRGRRRAARRSHILKALPGFCRVETAGRERDHLGTLRPKPSSARPRAGQERRQSLLVRAASARPLRQSKLPALPGNANVPDSPLPAPHPIRQAYFRRRGEPLRERLVPFAIARSGLVMFDRSAPLQRVHSPTQSLFEI